MLIPNIMPSYIHAFEANWMRTDCEMRYKAIRTFCTPDTVIKKHLHDCYKILEMLGAPYVTFLAFQEIQVKAMAIMREEQKKRDIYEAIPFGIERRWEPEERSSKEMAELERQNPFA